MPVWDIFEGGFADASQPWARGIILGLLLAEHALTTSPQGLPTCLNWHCLPTRGGESTSLPSPGVLRRDCGDHREGSKSPGPARGWGWSALPTAPARPPSLPPARPSWARRELTGGRHGPWVGTAGLNREQAAHEQERDKSDILRALGDNSEACATQPPSGSTEGQDATGPQQ